LYYYSIKKKQKGLFTSKGGLFYAMAASVSNSTGPSSDELKVKRIKQAQIGFCLFTFF
jgi:hypothetical protein